MRKQERRFRAGTKASPEVLAKRREYYLRPEVQARYKARAGTEKHKAYMREYRARPQSIERQKEHSRLLKHFPIGLYDKLLLAQGGLCAVCQRRLDIETPRAVHCDHDHDTLRPRGVLCRHCNHAEGHIRRTGLTGQEFADRLIAYLANPPADQFAEPDVHSP